MLQRGKGLLCVSAGWHDRQSFFCMKVLECKSMQGQSGTAGNHQKKWILLCLKRQALRFTWKLFTAMSAYGPMLFFFENITDSSGRCNFYAAVFQLASKLECMNINDSGITIIMITPDIIEDLIAGYNSIWMIHKIGKQIKFFSGQWQRLLMQEDLAVLFV